jgi:hypothetical protein
MPGIESAYAYLSLARARVRQASAEVIAARRQSAALLHESRQLLAAPVYPLEDRPRLVLLGGGRNMMTGGEPG